MDGFGKRFSVLDSRIDVANASNFTDFCGTLGSGPDSTTETSDCFVRVSGPAPHPLFNMVHSFDARTCPDGLPEAVQRALAPFRARKCPMMWIVFPALDPGSDRLMASLREAGLRLFADYPGMAIDLAALAVERPIPAGVSIEPVADSATMRMWVDIQAACDGSVQDRIKDVWVRNAALRGFDPHGCQQTYLARYRGKPVGCSILHLAADVAGVYHVATLPEVRGRGIGRAMTMQALIEGKARGCDVGVLHATRIGLNLYRSIGFVDRRCPVKLFLDLPGG
jgi:ribosomal protein S18 acetylase RimI-like enzyme